MPVGAIKYTAPFTRPEPEARTALRTAVDLPVPLAPTTAA